MSNNTRKRTSSSDRQREKDLARIKKYRDKQKRTGYVLLIIIILAIAFLILNLVFKFAWL